jgi:hypothetical protein
MSKFFIKEFGIVILCPERNLGGLRGTASCCRDQFGVPFCCIVGDNAKPSEIREMSAYCPVFQGGNTITSLIDVGVNVSKMPWNLVVMAGSYLRTGMVKKYRYFARSEKEVLYPVIDRKYIFDEASINGIMIHQNAIKEVGEFGSGADLSLVKLHWANKAIEKGYKFKALVGVKFF